MSQLTLQNHPVWQDLTKILEDIDVNVLVETHLNACGYKISGYWDEDDRYYEEITLPRSLKSELVSSSMGFTGKQRFVQLKFLLSALAESIDLQYLQRVGEVTLIYDENLAFIDECWFLDLSSPALFCIPDIT
jgi:hypothetical protein